MEADIIHKALGNEVRQRILAILSKRDEYLSEIAKQVSMTPQTTDFHLNILVDTGIIGYEWEAGKKYYHLKDKKILAFLREGRPLPPGLHPKPPHEIVMDAWKDLGERLDKIENRLDKIEKKLDKINNQR